MIKFKTRYSNDEPVSYFDPEDYEPEVWTEQTGYRSLHDIVEDMKKAGQKLNIEKHLIYNEGTEDDLEEVAEIYQGAFDIENISDARSQIKRLLESYNKPTDNLIITNSEIIPEGGVDATKTPTEANKEGVEKIDGKMTPQM